VVTDLRGKSHQGNSGEEIEMKAKDFLFFKELLLQQRSEILNKAESFKSESVIETTGSGDEGDLAVSELSLSLTLRLQERQTQLLQKIDRALAKIEEGSFGLCEQCEEPLNINRLKARPVATLCISCKEEQESKERVFA
jgi:DnaK suppressor protein